LLKEMKNKNSKYYSIYKEMKAEDEN